MTKPDVSITCLDGHVYVRVLEYPARLAPARAREVASELAAAADDAERELSGTDDDAEHGRSR